MPSATTLTSLVDATQPGALILLSAEDWSAIQARADIVVADAPLDSEISTILPDYPTLLTACQVWRSQTVPQLLAMADGSEIFAGDAIGVLQTVSSELAGLTPKSPPPFLPTLEMTSLAQNAGRLSTDAEALASPLGSFIAANRAADAILAQLLDPSWPMIGGPLDALEAGLGDATAGWQSIEAELAQLAQGTQVPSTEAWFAVDLAQAITGWQQLQQSAQQFTQQFVQNGTPVSSSAP